MKSLEMDIHLIDLFHRAEDYFSVALSQRHMDFAGAASAYCSDIKDSPLNTLVIKRAVPSLDDLLNKTTAFFELTHTPWCVVMHADLVNQDNRSVLKNFGFVPHEQSVAMCLLLAEYREPFVNMSCFQNMDNRLSSWVIPLRAFPAAHQEVPLQYKKSHELALRRGKNLTHLSLFDHSQIVSSLTLSWNENWARIDDLATVPELQGKGYATKLMSHALNIANKKAEYCFLEASSKGLSIYQKMGFKALFKNHVFLREGFAANCG